MPDLVIRTRDGGETTLSAAALDRLAASLRGDLALPGSPEYEDARRIWNAMIDRRPALVVRCRGAADVVRGLRVAAEHDLLVAVRGAGHNIAGNALADGALLLDLSAMRAVRVDPARRTARAEPGVTLGEFDRDTQAFALATPLGINSTTGIAGLTLGGGYGWLSRRHGLTVDNLRSADVATADGTLLTTSEHERPDLFWALRGGGGNFGVVTSFEYALHPTGPEVLAGLLVYPFADAAGLLRRYRDAVLAAPADLTAWVVLRQAPPLPFLPTAVHGRPVMVVALCWAGTVADGERAIRPLRAIGTPVGEHVGPTPYAAWQTAFDPLLAPGARNYWKTHNFATLHDGLVDTLVECVAALPGPQCEVFLAHLGGAVSARSDDATAYAGRAAQFVMNVHARWDDAADDERCIAWARESWQDTSPYATTGAYVNFLTHDEQARVRTAYGPNYDRLAAVKAAYDPRNVFRVNQNVVPTPGVAAPARSLGVASATGAPPRPA